MDKNQPSLSGLIGHEAALHYFSNSLNMNRLCSTYLLAGPEGIGKSLLAKVMAAMILCENRDGSRVCQVCPSCQAIDKGQSTFFHTRNFLGADSPQKSEKSEKTEKSDSLKKQKKPGPSGVEKVRLFIEDIETSSSLGNPCIYYLPNLQNSSLQVQNSLLKSLEEPPAGITFIISSDHPESVLETINSRSQVIALHPLKQNEVLKILLLQDFERDEAEALASNCEGLPKMAFKFSREPYRLLHQWFEELLRRYPSDFIGVAEQAQVLAAQLDLPKELDNRSVGIKDRHKVVELVDLFQSFFFSHFFKQVSQHFVAMQILNTTVIDLLAIRAHLNRGAHLALGLEQYFQVALARFTQITRYAQMKESTFEA